MADVDPRGWPRSLSHYPILVVRGQWRGHTGWGEIDNRRGYARVWLDNGHPFTNEKNPGGIGSALSIQADHVVSRDEVRNRVTDKIEDRNEDKIEAFHHVADRAQAALESEFDTDVEQVSLDDTSAVYGFTVDGVGHSIGLNVTP